MAAEEPQNPSKETPQKKAPRKLNQKSQKPSEEVDLPSSEDLKASAAAAQKALEASGTAQKLRETASSITDPKKREKLLRDAYNKEVEAHGSSKKARMLTSGAFQGGVGGAGIGAGVGAGVGTVVGTIVGGVTAIPTTGLGALVGSGVGAFHGPWIKLPHLGGGKKDGDKNKDLEGKDSEKGDKDQEGQEDDSENSVPNPEVLRQAADELAEEKQKREQGGAKDTTEKKKPRKIEIRSKQEQKKDG